MTDQVIIPPPRPMRSHSIKNLVPRLPERGRIAIGMKGKMMTSKQGNEFQPPQKLDHFRVTTLDRGQDGNFLPDGAFHEKYGDAPVEIPVRLIYDDPGLSFQTRYGCYIGRTLWCSGDGESATRLTNQPTDLKKPGVKIEPREVPCTCHRQAPDYQGADRCRMNGSLSVLIEDMGGVGGVWRWRTTSYNSILGIMSSLAFLRSVTGGILANIPMVLRVQPKQAVSPVNQQAVTIYIVSLEYAGTISELQQIAHQIALDRATTHMSIEHIEDEARRVLELAGPADAVLPGDTPEDIVAEFYPETGELVEPPPRPTRAEFGAAPEPEPQPEPEPPEPEVPTYPVITEDQEEETCPVEKIAERLAEVFQASANRGRKEWMTASENNMEVINMLRADDHEAVAEAIVQSWYACDPQKTAKPAAAPLAQEKPPAAPKAPPKSKTTMTAPKTAEPVPHGTAERADLWGMESFAIEVPKVASGGDLVAAFERQAELPRGPSHDASGDG